MMHTARDVSSSNAFFVCRLILAVFVLPVMTLLRRRPFSRYFPPSTAGTCSRLDMNTEATIRPMTAADMEHVLAIERLSHRSPWSRAMFESELTNNLARIDLLWWQDALAGYLCTWLVGRELSILNVATAPAMRRRGVARILLEHVLARNLEIGLDCALLEVRISNQAAISLYRSFGFRRIACRRNYYRDGEDALVMAWSPAASQSSGGRQDPSLNH